MERKERKRENEKMNVNKNNQNSEKLVPRWSKNFMPFPHIHHLLDFSK